MEEILGPHLLIQSYNQIYQYKDSQQKHARDQHKSNTHLELKGQQTLCSCITIYQISQPKYQLYQKGQFNVKPHKSLLYFLIAQTNQNVRKYHASVNFHSNVQTIPKLLWEFCTRNFHRMMHQPSAYCAHLSQSKNSGQVATYVRHGEDNIAITL